MARQLAQHVFAVAVRAAPAVVLVTNGLQHQHQHHHRIAWHDQRAAAVTSGGCVEFWPCMPRPASTNAACSFLKWTLPCTLQWIPCHPCLILAVHQEQRMQVDWGHSRAWGLAADGCTTAPAGQSACTTLPASQWLQAQRGKGKRGVRGSLQQQSVHPKDPTPRHARHALQAEGACYLVAGSDACRCCVLV